MTKQELELADS